MPKRLPIAPGLVTINGSYYSPTSLIWSGLRWHEAKPAGANCLSVPWCHVDDVPDGPGDAVYRIRPRFSGDRFVRCANGAWVIERGR